MPVIAVDATDNVPFNANALNVLRGTASDDDRHFVAEPALSGEAVFADVTNDGLKPNDRSRGAVSSFEIGPPKTCGPSDIASDSPWPCGRGSLNASAPLPSAGLEWVSPSPSILHASRLRIRFTTTPVLTFRLC